MAAYTAERDCDLSDLEDRVIAYAKTMLLEDDMPILAVVEYLRAEAILTPGLGLKRHECAGPRCQMLTDTPIRDTVAESWLGDLAGTYCSQACLTNAAEDAAEQVAIERNYELVDRYYGWGRD